MLPRSSIVTLLCAPLLASSCASPEAASKEEASVAEPREVSPAPLTAAIEAPQTQPSEPPVVVAPAEAEPVVLTPDPQAGKRHHDFDQPKRYTKRWNAADRDAYQKPAEIIAAMRIQPGQRVADLGAGTGYLVPHLAKAVGPDGRVWAVDVAPQMIDYLKKEVAKKKWSNVEPLLSGLDTTNLEPESVDRLVTLNTWHHIENRVAYAKHLLSVMAPGGEVAVVDFIPEETSGFGPSLEMRLSAERVADEFRAAGWSAEIVEETLPRHYIVRATIPK